MGLTYKKTGVDIDAGEKAVSKISLLVKSTFSKNVLSDIGKFGGMFLLDTKGYRNPVMVASIDGVGTKLKIANSMNYHKTIGEDLVNHCVNDILTLGATPLFFLDYIGVHKISPETIHDIVEGMVKACREINCSLISGEMAEMPEVYKRGDCDIVGTIIGIVDRDSIVDGSKIEAGNVIIGLESNGLHTNGYTLARKILMEKFSLSDYIDELDSTLGEELLRIHKPYFHQVSPLIAEDLTIGMAHITGGGLEGNLKRILPADLRLKINWNSWKWPHIFSLIQKLGNVSTSEMRRTFNMGIGFAMVVKVEHEERVIKKLKASGENPVKIGIITK